MKFITIASLIILNANISYSREILPTDYLTIGYVGTSSDAIFKTIIFYKDIKYYGMFNAIENRLIENCIYLKSDAFNNVKFLADSCHRKFTDDVNKYYEFAFEISVSHSGIKNTYVITSRDRLKIFFETLLKVLRTSGCDSKTISQFYNQVRIYL
jgi:hypothetical protein